MKYLTIIFLLFLGMAPGVAQQAGKFSVEHVYPIEASHSYVQFVATYMGYAKVRGSFDDFKGSIYYHPAFPENTSISFRVKVESVDTNNDWRDKDLKSANWFDSEQHPEITFISTGAKASSDGLVISGDLTIKGVTQSSEINLDAVIGVMQDTRGDDQVIFQGSHTLSRKSFGIEGRGWSAVKEGIASLSDDIVIEFSMLGKQINEGNATNFVRNAKRPPGKVYQAYKDGGMASLTSTFAELKDSIDVNPNLLKIVGYVLLKTGNKDHALAVFQMNAEEFPEDADVYDSLGEAYLHLGDHAKAKELYTKSWQLDADNYHAKEILRHL